MELYEAIETVKRHGFLIITREELDTVIAIAIEKALAAYDKKRNQEKLFTKKEAAEMLGIHPTTLSRWLREGRIKASKGGRISYSEILNFITGR